MLVLFCTGEVPNLMGNDDQEQIAAAMRPLMTAAGLAMSKPAINAFFVDRCVKGGA
jgi:dynein heavy chain